jgi:hypothetical protein
MLIHHDDIELTAGDDWTIPSSLTDEEGDAVNLSNIVGIQWIMLGPDGQPCLPPGSAIVTIVDPPTDGMVTVTVPNEVTRSLSPGRYADAMRVIFPSDLKSTVWTGSISVDCNSFDSIDNVPTPMLN